MPTIIPTAFYLGLWGHGPGNHPRTQLVGLGEDYRARRTHPLRGHPLGSPDGYCRLLKLLVSRATNGGPAHLYISMLTHEMTTSVLNRWSFCDICSENKHMPLQGGQNICMVSPPKNKERFFDIYIYIFIYNIDK